MPDRDPRFERLRVLAAVAVVWLHAASLVLPRRPSVTSAAWWTANVADAFSRWSVPVFVMLTGALGLQAAGQIGALAYYRRRARGLLIPLVAWTAIYVLFRALTEPGYTGARALETIRLGTPYYHLWYLYMLVGLTLAMPFLGVLARQLAWRELALLAGLCFAIAAPEIVYRPARATFLPTFLPFVGYLLAGHLLRHAPRHPPSGTLLRVAFLGAYLVAILTAALVPMIGAKAWAISYHYLNPLVVLTALALFAAFLDARVGAWLREPWLARLAPLTFGVFLVHPLWLWGVDRQLGVSWKAAPWWGIPTVTALVLVASALTTLGLQRVPGLRRVVGSH